jgi:Sel1 repeat
MRRVLAMIGDIPVRHGSMRHLIALALLFAASLSPNGRAQQPSAEGAPRIDERVAQIRQTAPGAPWSFIGYEVNAPGSVEWFVASSTPRGGTMGRHLSANEPHTAVLVLSSETLDKPVESDTALLELARSRHAKLAERWTILRHDEIVTRHAGTRCARHVIEAREPEVLSPRKDASKVNARRNSLFVTGISCVHPTDATSLVEIGVSERSRASAMTPAVLKDAEALLASLSFHRYSEQALQKSAEAARTGGLAEAEAVLKPYVEADAAWARFFLAQILERASPAPDNVGARLRTLLEPAADRGLADAQWALGRLYLRGAPGTEKDPARAEALLRRAAERGNPAAAFQLGLSLLSGTDGMAANSREAALWIQRAAFRGQKEAQEMLAGAKAPPAAPKR